MSDNKIIIYRFNRGEKFSCLVKVINGGDNVLIDKIIVPPGTSDEVIYRLCEEAETFALKKVEEEKYGAVSE